MKRFISSLRELAQTGRIKRGPILLTLALLVVGLGLVALIPVYPLWALQLIGLPISITLRSYFGSMLMIFFFFMLRSGKKEG